MQSEPAPSLRPRSNLDTILKIGGIILIAVLLVALGMAIGAMTKGRWNAGGAQDRYGPGMMGGGRGWDGSRGSRSAGPSMMGGYIPDSDLAPADGERLTLDEAVEVAEAYAAQYSDDLEVAEVMEFDNHFYAEIVESETGVGAIEILIDPLTAAGYPEPGPNMMWNTKYGHMGGGRGPGMMGGWRTAPSGEMTITPEEALDAAQDYLDAEGLDLTVGDEAEAFYGYYTIHTMTDGEVVGMLSVNGYTGEVWLHTWHGTFAGMTGEHED